MKYVMWESKKGEKKSMRAVPAFVTEKYQLVETCTMIHCT